jgi:glycosyltransferase involved in cell wall biosynthesis
MGTGPAEGSRARARPGGVSVLIATRDRAASLRETLRSLASVEIPADVVAQVLVIDNGSTDETPAVVAEFAREAELEVVYLLEPTPGKCRALNLGLARASGDVFLFTDDDVRFPANWIDGMSRPIREGRADTVQGGVRWSPELLRSSGATPFVASVVASTEHKSREELEHGLIGANMAVSRRAYELVGAFDEELGPAELGAGEETLLAWQLQNAGRRHLVLLDVAVEHHFDAARINRGWILQSAERKGRSLGYIDYHWRHEDVRRARLGIAVLGAKESVRTLLTPAAWPSRTAIPEWKYAYRASRCRLEQLLVEAAGGPRRNYAYLGLEKRLRGFPPRGSGSDAQGALRERARSA